MENNPSSRISQVHSRAWKEVEKASAFAAGLIAFCYGAFAGTPGNPKWVPPFTAENAVQGSPAISPDGTTIYVTAGAASPSQSGKLYAINLTTGSIKSGWPVELNNSKSRYGGTEFISSPVVANNTTIYVASTDGTLYSLNSSGVLNWSLPLRPNPARAISVGCSVALAFDGTVYVTFDDDTALYAVDPA